MGITFVKAKLINPKDEQKVLVEEFLVDSGAVYSVVSGDKLEKLGVKPLDTQTFTLADGTHTKREIGEVMYEFEGIKRTAPVVFGKRGDSTLLGAMTLEALGLILDPFKRQLRPMKLLLAKLSR